MASHFRTKHGIAPVNIEFDGLKKKEKECPASSGWAKRRREPVNCSFVQEGQEAGGWRLLPENWRGTWQGWWLWHFGTQHCDAGARG